METNKILIRGMEHGKDLTSTIFFNFKENGWGVTDESILLQTAKSTFKGGGSWNDIFDVNTESINPNGQDKNFTT